MHDRAAAQRACRRLDVPGGGAPRAVDGLEDLGSSRADEPREADDLAGADRERDVLEDAGQSEALDLEDGGRAAGDRDCGREDVRDRRPVMSRISSAVGVSATASPLAIERPSLSTVMRSPIWRISSRRCVM